jgi:shikimate kinase
MVHKMRISIIGMSGCGKTHWSKKLAEHGFHRFCCDDMIAQKLASELVRSNGAKMEVGEWMGFPYQPRYKEHEHKYLRSEIEALREIVGFLESPHSKNEKDIVIDTTGSSIYTGEQLLKRLRGLTTIVHLSTPPAICQQMLEAYMERQRPVLWRGLFKMLPSENEEEALVRCYSELLSSRERLYERHADVTIDYSLHSNMDLSVSEFLKQCSLI